MPAIAEARSTQQLERKVLREGMLERGQRFLDMALPHILVPQIAGEMGIKDLKFEEYVGIDQLEEDPQDEKKPYCVHSREGKVSRGFDWGFGEDGVNSHIEVGVYIYSGTLYVKGKESVIRETIAPVETWMGKIEEVVKPAIRRAMENPQRVESPTVI